MVRLVCTSCDNARCELSMSKKPKAGYDLICPLYNENEGPMAAEWKVKGSRCE